ncbi:hypothetical protein GW17_00029880 [Ensete ventricosum]|nr:hypothetical protein GW17_00029880 [Ensete ventricosum]
MYASSPAIVLSGEKVEHGWVEGALRSSSTGRQLHWSSGRLRIPARRMSRVGFSTLLFTISFPSLNTTLRDLEVMKVGHDLDTAVTKGSLVSIREQYNIPIEYGLHIPQPG